MIPKDKALKLVHDMYFAYGEVSMAQAKQCALIAVDEILELTKKHTYNPFDWNEITGFYYDKYWQEVKQEIENL